MQNRDLREYVDFLRRALPEEDRIALSDAALERVARHALTVREETPWGRDVPEWIFRDYVLFPRINDEFPEAYHAPLWQALRARLAGLSMTEAALEVNVWCAEHVVYQSTDNRTAGPLTTLRRGFGRCGEESTLLTAALRAAGIPARQMYSPRWAHCDDNHAWVEAWLDGRWRYMGACEPEPEPDSGWFIAAASKAMLVHTRAFGEPPEGERVERSFGSFSIVNRTRAYARTRRLTVRVTDGGRPVPGAAVRFELANMAELYPISEKQTDSRGEAELETGLGTLRVHVTDGRRWLAQTADADRVEIDLRNGFSCEPKGERRQPGARADCAAEGADKDIEATCDIAPQGESRAESAANGSIWGEADRAASQDVPGAKAAIPPAERFVQRPPRETRIQPSVHAEAVARRHAETLRRCERLRDARNAELASDDAVIARARGNAGEIRAFLADARFAEEDSRTLLSTLREKDLADASAETLADALETALPAKNALPEAIWREAVLCPRIADEKLLPVRRALRDALGEGLCPLGEQQRFGNERGEASERDSADVNEAQCAAAPIDGTEISRERVEAAERGSADVNEASRAAAPVRGTEISHERVEAAERGSADVNEASSAAAPIDGTEISRERGEAFETARAAACAADKAGSDVSFAFSASDGNDGKTAASTHGAGETVSRRDGTDGFAFTASLAACADGAAAESLREIGAFRTARMGGAVSESLRENGASLAAPELPCVNGASHAVRVDGTAPKSPRTADASRAARARELWRRIEERVRLVHSDFPLIPDPRAVLKAGRATPLVRDILFAAAARACGIPARLNPADGEKEIWDGAWRPLLPAQRGRLRLTNRTGAPRVYGVDFTVGILENGAFRTLNFWGETMDEYWEREAPAGLYRAVHCVRQIDGSVDGELRYARATKLVRGELTLEPLPDRTGEKLLHRRLPELCAEELPSEERGEPLPDCAGEKLGRLPELRAEELPPEERGEPLPDCASEELSRLPELCAEELPSEERGEPQPDRTGEKLLHRRLPKLLRRRLPELCAEELPLEERGEPLRDCASEKLLHRRLPELCAEELPLEERGEMPRRAALPPLGRPALLAVLEPGAEPTEHFLNEILEIRDEMNRVGLELLIARPGQRENAKLAETLRAVPHARLWTNFDADALLQWRRALDAGDLRLPLAAAFNARGEALFAFTNYHVGSVRALLGCIAADECGENRDEI